MKDQTMLSYKSGYKCFIPCLILLAALLLPLTSHAEESKKTVRVGWYESTFNTTDENGRRSGYAYEYQQKIAAYTGWEYEYVTGGWSALLQMLIDGEIDLMSDVSYTEERAKSMLYSSLPMGTEEYYLFTAPGNRSISQDDPSTLNGKTIGVNKDSIQADFYRDWAERNNVTAQIQELTGSEDESLQMLTNGSLDAYVTVDSFTDPSQAVPMFKVGASDFYFAVTGSRPDLQEELNLALEKIQNENRFFNEDLFDKYIKRSGANAFLTMEETDWLSSHGTIRVGYQDNYLAFCAQDPQTGNLTGALKDFLDYASDCMVNAHLNFKTIAYPTAQAALDDLKAGELDCVFPANLSDYDAEEIDAVMTPPIMHTDIYAVVRQTDQNIFSQKGHVVVAVNEGNPNYDSFLADHFPNWRTVYFPDTSQCLRAVADRVADCVLVSNYRFNNISRMCEKLHLTTISTGINLDYCFVMNGGNPQLYSILSKVANHVPDSVLSSALTYYITEDARLTFVDFIMDNLAIVMIVTGAVLLVILVLMMRSMRAEKTARKLISATETDELTGLYNRDFFFQYANRMYQSQPDHPMDAIVMNLDQFHSVNALHGRDFGDKVLRTLGDGIREITNEYGGIAGRFEADRFDIYCPHTGKYQEIFDRLQSALDALAPNISIRLRMGVMPWQKGLDPVQLFDRARSACSMARGHYKEHLIVYDDTLGDKEMLEQRLLNDLRRALESYEFDVYYQPKFDILSDPPRLVSAEALVRWNHPQLGLIAPDAFIPLFERNGKIAQIDQYVWEAAARQVARWREQYGVVIPVSVNLSRVDVFDPDLEKNLDQILQYNRLDHKDFRLEVTESAYTENAEQLIRVVKSLREKGYEVEMDDFGTGYSSLSMLSAMPVDVLKMDRTFVRNIEHEEKDIQLVALILSIAKNLEVPVIAEGVETGKQVLLLKDLGCTIVQGYYFSHPLHPTEFESKYLKGATEYES